MRRAFGTITLCGGDFVIDAEPHVTATLKRVFPRAHQGIPGRVRMRRTAETCRDLRWFMDRYPLSQANGCVEEIAAGAKMFDARAEQMDTILSADYKPRKFDLALPLRRYQAQAVDLYLANRSLLLGDDVGLGKTAVAIGSFTEQAVLPALVVTMTHLPLQWEREIQRFLPGVHTHILKKGTPYPLPSDPLIDGPPAIIITNYHKLHGWRDVLGKYVSSVVFDECQDLRRSESQKYDAAKAIADAADYRLGLSATPIYNYGDEFWNVTNVISPGVLGSAEEFRREWCGYDGRTVHNPKALGTYVREQHVMLRRTRRDVGRELPELSKVPFTVDHDARELHKIQGSAAELAKIILRKVEATREDRYTASGRFDMVMRQATGVAKAPFVADFVNVLLESEPKVVLFGWHRAVYGLWESRIDAEIAWYTGSESTSGKEKARRAFVEGDARVLFMSLRSGGGLDGLQTCGCRTVVFGELDWSPGVHEQCIGRVHRDGQAEPVVAYYLVADDGADPIMADTLGLKRRQAEGIRDPNAALVEKVTGRSGKDAIKAMAEAYLRGGK